MFTLLTIMLNIMFPLLSREIAVIVVPINRLA